MISKQMRHVKRSSVEPWIEIDGETGCIEPAFKQNTNDDDDDDHIEISLNHI